MYGRLSTAKARNWIPGNFELPELFNFLLATSATFKLRRFCNSCPAELVMLAMKLKSRIPYHPAFAHLPSSTLLAWVLYIVRIAAKLSSR